MAARYALLSAIRQIEPLSLIVATEDELQIKLDKIKDNNQHRRHAIRINQLLRFAGRNFQLLASGRQRKDIKYLSWDDVQTMLPFISSDEVKYLAVTLYVTGCRIGEAFTFHDERKLKPSGTLFIFRQMLRTGETRDELKNNKPHNTVLIPEGIESFKAWCAVDIDRKKELRASAACSQIRRASRSAFPKQRSKWISPHDLRHSYAIYALEQGNSLSDIASLLGDDEATVRDYYTGYVLTDRATERIAETFKKKA